jgi:hypothetical protein
VFSSSSIKPVNFPAQLHTLCSDPQAIIDMVVRYQILQPGGQQWAASDALMDELVKTHDIDTEGFASPLNSYFIRSGLKAKEPTKYRVCTLFKDDSVFGCDTDFFATDLRGRRSMVNPVFIEKTLTDAAQKCLAALRSDQSTTIVFYGPNWEDSEYFQLLKQSPFLREHRVLNRNEFSVLTPTGEMVSRTNHTLFTLSN